MTEPAGTPSHRDLTRGIDHDDLCGRILVVDDEMPNRVYMRKLLTARGSEVIEASGGEQALALARANPPDLVLVDVVMPGLSGNEVCFELQNDPRTADVPVIMVTAKTGIEDIECGFIAGAFDYIRKPFNPRELLTRVRNALALKRRDDELRRWRSRVSAELKLASKLQAMLLSPHPWVTSQVEIFVAYRPSSALGGDVFDMIPLADGRLCLYIGDVCGHGVGPAILSSLLKAMVSGLAENADVWSPAQLGNELTRRFRQHVSDPALYATFLVLLLDPVAGTVRGLSCGHPSPVLRAPDGAVRAEFMNEGGGLPLGFGYDDQPPYDLAAEAHATLAPDSRLLLYTDGLTEARQTASGEECGAATLAAAFGRICADPDIANPATALLDRLTADGYDLTADDCTAIVVQTLDPRSILLQRDVPPDHHSVHELAAETERALLAAGWGEEPASAVRLLAMEHGANVVAHARPPADSRIHLTVRATPGGARLVFKDRGPEWDFAARFRAAAAPADDSECGRGLLIIRSIARNIEGYRRGNENTLLYSVSKDYRMSC